MKGQRTAITDDLYEYIITNYAEESKIIKELYKEYEINKIPKISITPEQGKFLYVIAKMINAKKILEIGTLIGYSAIWMAEALPENGKLITVEVSEKHHRIASEFIEKTHLSKIIDIKLGRAFDIMPSLLINEAPFDMIFVDADKEKYPQYFEQSLKLLRKGGIIAMDNTLSKGRVLDNEPTKKGIIGIKNLNEIMGKSDKVDSVLIPIADGISVGVKK